MVQERPTPSAMIFWGVRVCGSVSALIGGFWLSAWLAGYAAAWSAAGGITVKTNMALGQLLGGASLLLVAGQSRAVLRRLGTVAAVLVLLIGSLTLSEHVFGWNLHIDQLLATEPPGAAATASPNRMGPPGSSSLALLGAGLLCLALRRPASAPYFGLGMCLINVVPAVGFLYGIEEFYTKHVTAIAWPTVIALLAMGAGLILSHPRGRFLTLLLRDDPGGALFRRLLPAVVFVPLSLGCVRVMGQYHGIYDTATGTGLLVIALVLVFTAMLWLSAVSLSRSATRERHTHKALQRERDRLVALINSIHDEIWFADADKKLRMLNPTAVRELGLSLDQAAEVEKVAAGFEVYRPDGTARPVEEAPLLRALRGEVVSDEEEIVRIPGRDELRHKQVSAAPVKDAQGAIIGSVSVMRDITERKRAETAVREANERYELVLAGAETGIWDWDVPGHRVAYSTRWKEMRGFADNEITEAEAEWSNRIHPDDAPRVLAAVAAHFEGRTAVFAEEYRVQCKDGSWIWVTDRGLARHDANGRVVRMAGSEADITARKQAELELARTTAMLETLLKTAPLGFCYFDRELRYVRINDRLAAMNGIAAADHIGKTVAEVVPTLLPTALQVTGRILASGQALVGHEFRGATAAQPGVMRYWSESWYPVRDTSGQISGFGVLVEEITERKRLEDERNNLLESERAARQEAEKAVRLKDEFLATISHELRNPLNVLMGWTQLLAKGSVPVPKAVDVIVKSTSALSQIIADLLDMSRIVSGKTQLKPEQADLAGLIGNVLDGVRLASEAKNIETEAVVDPDLQPITCDPDRVQQILHNLLNNAVKFTPEGGRVAISVRQSMKYVDIAVADNGQGIAPEFLPHVFDQFRQADQSKSRHYGGLGLGLTIVRHLVELHGGTIRAESEGVGRGATFTFSLPRQIANIHRERLIDLRRRPLMEEAMPGAADAAGHTAGDLDLLRDCRVLVVDDDADNCEFVARVLEESGAIVHTATSGEDGWRLIPEFRPDLIISDIGMPGMNGYDFVRRLRASGGEFAGVCCLALTAYARPEDRNEAMQAGFDEHLAKPFKAAQLAQILARVGHSATGCGWSPRAPSDGNVEALPSVTKPTHTLLAEDNARSPS